MSESNVIDFVAYKESGEIRHLPDPVQVPTTDMDAFFSRVVKDDIADLSSVVSSSEADMTTTDHLAEFFARLSQR